MSDTPRTDALEDQYFENRNHVSEVFLHAQQLERELAESVAAERERCAKVCEEFYSVENIAQVCLHLVLLREMT